MYSSFRGIAVISIFGLSNLGCDVISFSKDRHLLIDENSYMSRSLIPAKIRTNYSESWHDEYQDGHKLEEILNCTGYPDPSRWAHETPLYRNNFVCSISEAFAFGLNFNGDLIWADLKRGIVREYFNPSFEIQDSVSYFKIGVQGDFQVFDEQDQLLWVAHPKTDGIRSRSCLKEPFYQCPYLHLHNDGVNVINYRKPRNGWWKEKDIHDEYEF